MLWIVYVVLVKDNFYGWIMRVGDCCDRGLQWKCGSDELN